MSKDLWPNTTLRIPKRDFKSQYEQSWATQFEKAEEIIVVVPNFFVEEAKRIILPFEDEMQLPNEWQLERNPLYLFTRYIKPSTPLIKPEEKLAQAYIPHCIINVSKQAAKIDTGMFRAKVDMFYWLRPTEYMLQQWMVIDTRNGIQKDLTILDGYLRQLPWQQLADEATEIKTLRLLKGNDDGLPKTHVEGQNWSAN
jgi:hypothetical protein